jgi:DNA-binding SARP family transcriptional activator
VDADRVLLALSRASGRHEDQIQAALAADRLAAAGVVQPVEPDRVRITALGRFTVSIGGRPLPAGAWQSRKARDLVRILVARRGRPVGREEMAELLWPGEPADRVAHRLSVALSTARQVLSPSRQAPDPSRQAPDPCRQAPDPSRQAPIDHAICADSGSLALNLATVTLDAENFAGYVRHGLSALRAGRAAEARGALEAAERAYTGDFFEDEPYLDLAVDAREELRATFLQALRALAELARADGRPDDAVRYLHRVLGVDRYDEPAHRALLDVLTGHGRHGEALRARERYAAVMTELSS